jgi:hypothetical protein
VQEHLAILSNHIPHFGDVQHTLMRREQAVYAIGVILHYQIEVADDAEDGKVILTTSAAQGIRIEDVVFLVLLETLFLFPEPLDFACEMGKHDRFGGQAETIDIEIGFLRLVRNVSASVSVAAHDGQIGSVADEEGRRVDQTLVEKFVE